MSRQLFKQVSLRLLMNGGANEHIRQLIIVRATKASSSSLFKRVRGIQSGNLFTIFEKKFKSLVVI